MIKKLCAVAVLLPVFISCSFITGLLHMKTIDIIAWTPNRECVAALDVAEITVIFSSPMNRTLGEDAFSLSRNGDHIRGHFSWQEQDTIMRFLPEVPFTNGQRYSFNVGDSAEDIYGNSLTKPFHFEFATAEELVPPEIVLHEPADGAVVPEARAPIHLVFSEPIETASFYIGFSIFPSITGSYLWSVNGDEVEFLPLTDYQPGQMYEVDLSREICDKSGNQIAEELRFSFRTEETQMPSVSSVETLAGGKLLISIESGGGVDPSLEIEKDEQFLISFTQGLTQEQIFDLIQIDPYVPFSLAWDDERQSCLLRFDQELNWNQVYQIELPDLTYPFVINGPRSIPISVTTVTYCADLDAPAGVDKYVLLDFSDNLDFSGAINPAFDFYLEHAVGEHIDLGSFLQAFSVSIAADCIFLTQNDVELSPLVIDPYILPQEGQSIVRLHCSIVEDPGATGTVTFRINSELRDSALNHLTEEFVLLINNN